ncbi:MAG: ion transporter [Coriobacteriaceae bacterium]|nr:ion transporter [Coriobacteriaceae bacterium]
MRAKVTSWVESQAFERFILVVILLNTIDLGLGATKSLVGQFGFAMEAANTIFTGVYVVEMLLKVFAWRTSYFKKAWNVFDFCIVVLSLAPVSSVFGGIRILRILKVLLAFRAMRLISGVKQLRKIVHALLSSLPGIGWAGVLMMLVYYIYALIGISLYSDIAPELFGGIPESFVTLFSLTTMEGWQDTVFPFTSADPLNWVYFLTFLIISSFILMNLIVGIVVDSIDEFVRLEPRGDIDDQGDTEDELNQIKHEMHKLHDQLDHMQALLEAAQTKNDRRKADKW